MVFRLYLIAVGVGVLPGILIATRLGLTLLSVALCVAGPLLCAGALLCLTRAMRGS